MDDSRPPGCGSWHHMPPAGKLVLTKPIFMIPDEPRRRFEIIVIIVHLVIARTLSFGNPLLNVDNLACWGTRRGVVDITNSFNHLDIH